MPANVRSYLGELVGTFALVFIGTGVATLQGFLPGYGDTGWLGISFAFGFTLMVLVWVIGPVSGCHINPAVTIAMLIAGKIEGGKAAVYIVVQVVGALVASLVLLVIVSGIPGYELGNNGLGANGNPRQMGAFSLLMLELVMTALFLVVILGATRDDAAPGVAGIAIGGFLFVAHLVGAQLGDASLNPARSLGPALVQGGAALAGVWIFIVGPFAGAILGLLLYRLLYRD
ncbi:MAG: aquaporin [Spirochaetaceae bacterium]|nr:aquaporin [Spirochaetaceae bacterium]